MQNYVLFADSDCDITPVDCAKYGFHLISMPYSVEGKTIYPYEDFEVFEADAYYDMLRGGTLPTTSALTKEKYIEYFEPIFAAGKDILYAHFSRAMSGSFGNMDKAYEEGIFTRIFTTNLVYRTPELLARPWYAEVNMCKYVAYIIDTLNHDRTISHLLDQSKKIHNLLAKYNKK